MNKIIVGHDYFSLETDNNYFRVVKLTVEGKYPNEDGTYYYKCKECRWQFKESELLNKDELVDAFINYAFTKRDIKDKEVLFK